MAAGMVGADVEQLRALAKQFDAKATQLRALSGTLTAQINQTQAWQGGDANRFRSEWSSRHRQQLVQAAEALHTAAQTVNKNANEQQQASDGAGGAVSGAGGGAGGGGASAVGAVAAAAGGGHSLMDLLKTGMGVKGLISHVAGLATKGTALFKFLKNGGGAVEGAIAKLVDGAKTSRLFGLLTGDGMLGKAGAFLGKAGLVGTLVGGAMSALTGDGYGGVRGLTSRVLGGAAAVGAGGLLFAADTALMATGVGAPIAVGAIAAYGAWEAGNYLWDHRAAIGHFVSNAAQGVAHVASNVASGVSHAASTAVHAVGNVASGAIHAVSHLIPHVSIF